MKTLKILLPVAALFLFSCEDAALEANNDSDSNDETKDMISDALDEIAEADRLFEVASGKITYEYSGKWTGTETVWFDQYGKRVVVEQDIHHSKANHNKTKMIWTGDNQTSYICKYISAGEEVNSSENTYIRPKDTELSIFSHGNATQLAYTYDHIGDGMKAGKQATGWKSKTNDITGWIWKGIDLEYNNMGVIKKALKFESLKEIPKDKLDPHNGF